MASLFHRTKVEEVWRIKSNCKTIEKGGEGVSEWEERRERDKEKEEKRQEKGSGRRLGVGAVGNQGRE